MEFSEHLSQRPHFARCVLSLNAHDARLAGQLSEHSGETCTNHLASEAGISESLHTRHSFSKFHADGTCRRSDVLQGFNHLRDVHSGLVACVVEDSGNLRGFVNGDGKVSESRAEHISGGAHVDALRDCEVSDISDGGHNVLSVSAALSEHSHGVSSVLSGDGERCAHFASLSGELLHLISSCAGNDLNAGHLSFKASADSESGRDNPLHGVPDSSDFSPQSEQDRPEARLEMCADIIHSLCNFSELLLEGLSGILSGTFEVLCDLGRSSAHDIIKVVHPLLGESCVDDDLRALNAIDGILSSGRLIDSL